jgi:aconitate hydratase
MGMPYPRFSEPDTLSVNTALLVGPDGDGTVHELEIGPNIKPLPEWAEHQRFGDSDIPCDDGRAG